MSAQLLNGYAGDVSVTDAYAILEEDESAVLVDVRTKAEWTYVGAPDLSSIGKETIFVEWQQFPSMQIAPDFAPNLLKILREREVAASAPVLFLCRSGARSRSRGDRFDPGGTGALLQHCRGL